MAIQPVTRPVEAVQRAVSIDSPDAAEAGSPAPAETGDEALEFVRFCYRRRRVAWPALYDEMCAVAARGAFRGLGYAELAEHGISFCLSEMRRFVALAERVVAEERPRSEPSAHPSAITLTAVPARA